MSLGLGISLISFNVLEMNPDVVVTITTISLTFVALKMIVEEAVLLPHGPPWSI